MCEQCLDLDQKIEYCKLLLLTINDKTTADGLTNLIERYEAARQARHADAQAAPGR